VFRILCCVPLNWWTRDHESTTSNGTHFKPRLPHLEDHEPPPSLITSSPVHEFNGTQRYSWRCGKWNTLICCFVLCFKIYLNDCGFNRFAYLLIIIYLLFVYGYVIYFFLTNFLLTFITACSELQKVLFLAPSVFLFVYEMSWEPLNGLAPNSQKRRVWSLAWMSWKIKVKGQSSRSLRTKTAFLALLAACVRFMFSKTSLASSSFCCAGVVCCTLLLARFASSKEQLRDWFCRLLRRLGMPFGIPSCLNGFRSFVW